MFRRIGGRRFVVFVFYLVGIFFWGRCWIWVVRDIWGSDLVYSGRFVCFVECGESGG